MHRKVAIITHCETCSGLDYCECDNDASWIRDLWLGAFTGMCTAPLLWENQHRTDLWIHFGRLNSFVSGYDFNEDGGWVAYHDYDETHSGSGVDKYGVSDLFYLRSPRREEAIGVIGNRTYNFYTQWDVVKCGQYIWEDISLKDEFEAKNNDISYDDEMYNFEKTAFNNNEFVRANVKSGHCYEISYIDPFTLQTISTEQKLNAIGQLKLNFPYLTGSATRPILLVKIEKVSCFKNQDLPEDLLTNMEMEKFNIEVLQCVYQDSLSGAKIFPNPASESVTIILPFPIDFCRAELLTCTGVVIKVEEFSDKLYTLNLSNLSKGVYIFRLSYNEKVETFKLIIQ